MAISDDHVVILDVLDRMNGAATTAAGTFTRQAAKHDVRTARPGDPRSGTVSSDLTPG